VNTFDLGIGVLSEAEQQQLIALSEQVYYGPPKQDEPPAKDKVTDFME